MQLSKLYSNKEGFKNIKFNLNGLNIVYAEVKSAPKDKKNSHDLGKTKLAELIDFLLLKKINKNHFLLKLKEEENSIFQDHIFYLELYLNSGLYLTVKRGVASQTKISFSLNEKATGGFNPPHKWAEDGIPIDRAKVIFSDYLKFDFFHNKDYDYRKSISYSLRTQNDFRDVYKLDKFSAGNDIDWKPFMFDLLGFKGDLLRTKYENDVKIENIKKFINDLKSEYSVKIEERDEIVADKNIVRKEFTDIEEQIDKFNFYNQDKTLIKRGIEEIESKINNLNSISYKLNYEINKLGVSIKNNFAFDLEKVKKVFIETGILFSSQLSKDFKDLLEFNKKLTAERNKLLRETLKKKESELKEINSQLSLINSEREKLLSYLTDSDTFKKFKIHQKDLVKVEGKLQKLEEKLNTIDKLIKKENEIEKLNVSIKSTIDALKKLHQTTEKNEKYSNIRSSFTEFFKKIMDENAVLSWNVNTNNNVDFVTPKVKSKSDSKKDTAKDEGNTYTKLLCVAFDLAILCNYNVESYFRFIYHDDVLSQQDNGVKTRFLELIYELTKTYKLQYIISVIKSDLPTDSEDKPIYFADNEIVLKLNDRDSSGTLFGFEF